MDPIRRRAAFILLTALVVGASSAVAGAQVPTQVPDETPTIVAAVNSTGAYVDPESSADAGAVAEVTRAIANDGDRWGLVVVAAEPTGGATISAETILDDLADQGSRVSTVAVLHFDDRAHEIGMASDEFDDDAIDRGVDRAADHLRADPAAGFAALYSAVTGRSLEGLSGAADEAGSVGSGGVNGGLVVLGLVVLLVIGALVLMWWTRSRGRRRVEVQVDASRRELRSQVSALADSILTLDDRVTLADLPIQERFAEVNRTYAEVLEQVDAAATLPQLEALAARMDDARWEVGAIEALLDGRPEPERPVEAPAACFFDPTHGAGTEQEELTTPAGTRTVGVCRRCAETLARGEQPSPRTVDVGGRQVPAPSAPRSAGGGGIDLGRVAQQVLVGGVLMGGMRGNGRYPRSSGPFGGAGPFGSGGGGRPAGGRSGGRSGGGPSGGGSRSGGGRGRGGRKL